ncbi:hypothetical protein SAMN03159475_0116 [Pseudomonas sp. NFPP33]|nr:hypothetical protein SAMN03159475_0116 [Pseudomonas sp. NFPP33]
MNDQTTPESIQDELDSYSELPEYISPVILRLADQDRPVPSPACETCPASLWFKTKPQLKCFCTRMHAIVWQTEMEEPPVMICDGREMALLALQEAQQD